MEYIFVSINNGWWLKINSIEKLNDYYEQTDSKWTNAFQNLIDSKEFCKGNVHADNLAYNIGFYGANRKQNPIKATLNFREIIYKNQLNAILEYGEIYINDKGGYFFKTKDTKYDKWIRKQELIFPDFNKNEIKIKKFPGGNHFYAYIGNVEVRNGDTTKWNTYEEAYENALKYIM